MTTLELITALENRGLAIDGPTQDLIERFAEEIAEMCDKFAADREEVRKNVPRDKFNTAFAIEMCGMGATVMGKQIRALNPPKESKPDAPEVRQAR